MASTEHGSEAVPLMTDDDLKTRSRRSSAPDSFEYVVYEDSTSDSETLSGSTMNDNESSSPSAYPDSKHSFTKDQDGDVENTMSQAETLPEYSDTKKLPRHIEIVTQKGEGGGIQEGPTGMRFCRPRRRGCFGRVGCRGCHRAGSQQSDKKRRVRRRVIFFIKAIFFLSFISFFVTRMCMRHMRKEGKMPIFKGDSKSDKQLLEDAKDSRKIVINRGSHSISGQYPLYDLLDLETTSGNIHVVVDPQPAHPDRPNEPARLVVKTLSGSVSVNFLQQATNYIVTYANGDSESVDGFPEDLESLKNAGANNFMQMTGDIPYRPYEVEIRSKGGSIVGNFIFASSAYLETHSGQISASFTPVISDGYDVDAVTIVTKTKSGSQSISVKEPLVIDYEGASTTTSSSEALAISQHITSSGAIQAEYPHSWAGNVTGQSASGLIMMSGEDLMVTERRHGYAKGVKNPEDGQIEWWGSHGDMDVLLEAKGSGAVVFHVKDEAYALLDVGDW